MLPSWLTDELIFESDRDPKNCMTYTLTDLVHIRDFQHALDALHRDLPMREVRYYLMTGERSEAYDPGLYKRVDELRTLRAKVIRNQFTSVLYRFRYYAAEPDEFYAILPSAASDRAHLRECPSPEGYFGADVLAGESLRISFDPTVVRLFPNVRIYELMMWYCSAELADLEKLE